MTDFDKFKFDINSLKKVRKPGISGFMRIKNEQEFLRLSILSHLEFYDEIIAVYNNCTDKTPEILKQLEQEYPNKIKVYHYEPKVHPAYEKEHEQTPKESVHSLANYYNYALAKTTFTVVTKLDADHLAIKQNLAPLIKKIRADINKNIAKQYLFSGLNLIKNQAGKIVVNALNPPNLFSGTGDIMYFPASEKFTFEQASDCELLTYTGEALKIEYAGIMYFHLKHLKDGFGFEHQSKAKQIEFMKSTLKIAKYIEFDVFRSRKFINILKKQYANKFSKNNITVQQMKFILHTNKTFVNLMLKLTKRKTGLQIMQLITLSENLKNIDFKDYVERINSASITNE